MQNGTKTRLESVFIPEDVSGMKNSSHAVGKILYRGYVGGILSLHITESVDTK